MSPLPEGGGLITDLKMSRCLSKIFLYLNRAKDYKTFFMLNSTQFSMKFFLLINVKMPTTVGILTFMSRKNSILGLYHPEKMLNFMIVSL